MLRALPGATLMGEALDVYLMAIFHCLRCRQCDVFYVEFRNE